MVMQTVQLSISDAAYAASVREALSRSCAWGIESTSNPDASRNSVMVLDETAFARLSLPLVNPERVVLIVQQDTREMMARAWDAGVVSVVSAEDSMSTVLLAIMAAALRIAKSHGGADHSGSSPTCVGESERLAPQTASPTCKRCKIQ